MSQSSAGGQKWRGEMLALYLVAERVWRMAVGAGSLAPGGSRWAHGGVRRGVVRLLLGWAPRNTNVGEQRGEKCWSCSHGDAGPCWWSLLVGMGQPGTCQHGPPRVRNQPCSLHAVSSPFSFVATSPHSDMLWHLTSAGVSPFSLSGENHQANPMPLSMSSLLVGLL